MKQVLLKKGQISVEDIPAPFCCPDEILVQVYYSGISSGTEIASVASSARPLYQKALEQPQKIVKVLEMLRKNGLKAVIAKVQSQNAGTTSLGYSAAGLVLEVGQNIKDIRAGDRVACAGAGIANHAEFIAVPRNLTVKVPGDLPLEQAATVTLGSIALQGLRRANPALGEKVAVIGLGVLGQLIVQLLKNNGCQVIGADLDQRKIDLALSLGLDKGINPAKEEVVAETIRWSDGYGVDTVIITASTESHELINQAMEMCRKKGRVVIVGAVGLNLKRDELYKKELDVLISTSYGPGRYDENYETKGRDYPYAYVRWTENRNMLAYLELLKEGKINLKPLIEKIYPVEKAAAAYEELKTLSPKPIIVLLEYNRESIPERKIIISAPKISRDKINVALVGGGTFARGMLLKNLRKLNNLFNIQAIVSKTGSNAKVIAEEYQAAYATTDFQEVLKDKNVDLVVIATRHHLHSQMAIRAAEAGKAIFLEKPMALNAEELQKLVEVLERTKVPFMVGFNRRFSTYAQKIKEIIKNRTNPLMINYQMNAGFIPGDHWVHTKEGGGLNIGEACHIYDLFNFLTESEAAEISAAAIDPKKEQYRRNDNFTATIKYRDGSVCNLVYTSLGSSEVPKERMEVYFDGKIIRLDDYKKMDFFGIKENSLTTPGQDKGHLKEFAEFAQSLKQGQGYPIPLWQLIQATEISFEVEGQLTGL